MTEQLSPQMRDRILQKAYKAPGVSAGQLSKILNSLTDEPKVIQITEEQIGNALTGMGLSKVIFKKRVFISVLYARGNITKEQRDEIMSWLYTDEALTVENEPYCSRCGGEKEYLDYLDNTGCPICDAPPQED